MMESLITFVIAHRLSTVRDADRILVLDHGRLVEAGTHPELMQEEGIYARLYELQHGTDSLSAGRSIVSDPAG